MKPILWKMLWFLLIGGMLGTVLVFHLRTRLTVPPADAIQRGNTLLNAKRVLVFGAHPDDVEWYLAGTLRRYALNGAEVHVVIASDGEKGPNRVGTADLRATRREEQQRAARIIGYTQVHFLGLPDRSVARDRQRLREAIDRLWKQVQPEAVFTWDPAYYRLPYLHPDHEGLGRVVLFYWRDLPLPRPALVFFHTRRPNSAIDISEVIGVKESALRAHSSQGLSGGGSMRALHSRDGGRVGLEYAELLRQEEDGQ